MLKADKLKFEAFCIPCLGVTYLSRVSFSLAPWTQCPLASMTYLTKWLNFVLSIANPYKASISFLHQSLGCPYIFYFVAFPLLYLRHFAKYNLLHQPVIFNCHLHIQGGQKAEPLTSFCDNFRQCTPILTNFAVPTRNSQRIKVKLYAGHFNFITQSPYDT